jgi:hypothetical protein
VLGQQQALQAQQQQQLGLLAQQPQGLLQG